MGLLDESKAMAAELRGQRALAQAEETQRRHETTAARITERLGCPTRFDREITLNVHRTKAPQRYDVYYVDDVPVVIDLHCVQLVRDCPQHGPFLIAKPSPLSLYYGPALTKDQTLHWIVVALAEEAPCPVCARQEQDAACPTCHRPW